MTTTTREADTMTETTTHVLRLKWTTSRGRDTYGWNVVTLTDETTGRKYRAKGGGYDMTGTVFASWLLGENKLRVALAREARKYARKEHDVSDLESMFTIARAIGAEITRTHDRKGNTTGWVVTLPA
jgi:hypothetical protein